MRDCQECRVGLPAARPTLSQETVSGPALAPAPHLWASLGAFALFAHFCLQGLTSELLPRCRPGENQVAASGPAVASHGGPIELTSFNIRSDPSPSGDSLGERGTSWASGPVIRSLVLRLSRHGKYEALKQPLLFFSSAATL